MPSRQLLALAWILISCMGATLSCPILGGPPYEAAYPGCDLSADLTRDQTLHSFDLLCAAANGPLGTGLAQAAGPAGLVSVEARAVGTRFVLTCLHGNPVGAPATPSVCEGTLTLERQITSFAGQALSALHFGVGTLELGDPSGSFQPTAFADCLFDNGTRVQGALALDDRTDLLPPSLGSSSSTANCTLTLDFVSATSAPGTTLHSLTVYEPGVSSSRCSVDSECQVGACGPQGLCQTGTSGDACLTSRDCARSSGYQCGPAGICQFGSIGDACVGDFDCLFGICEVTAPAQVGVCTSP